MADVLIISMPEAPKVAHDIHATARRFEFGEGGYERVMDLMEARHRRGFELLRGRYVRTGAVRDSLTHRFAPGAIRDLHSQGLEFGTDVWYAHFLTKSPHDRELGQVRKGTSAETAKGADTRSAVLFFPRSLEREIAREMLDWITEPL